MNEEKKVFQFDDLINDFFADLETGDENQVLGNYIKDFPEFEIELMEAAAYKRTVSELPERQYSKEEEELLNLRTSSIVQNLLYKYRLTDSVTQAQTQKAEEISPLLDLKAEIKQRGFTVKTFAHAAGLSETIIDAFHTREVLFSSIKRQAIENVATALGYPFELVRNFLRLNAVPEPSHLRADEPPRFSSQMDFSELIATDPDMTDDEKKYWLEQES
ncbi:MAG TPA: hypothetical protein PKY82_17505 [Pyrinomonadaceae bacterium]|nr:hypothetical protein [Pyrinomonadaceae bacterium]